MHDGMQFSICMMSSNVCALGLKYVLLTIDAAVFQTSNVWPTNTTSPSYTPTVEASSNTGM